MLVHGELKGWPRLRLEMHLVRCAECRNRRRRMGSLTVSLSHILQNPSLGYRTFRAAPRMALLTMALAVLMVSGAGWLTADYLNRENEPVGVVAGQGESLRSCELHPDEKAIALSTKKKKLEHPNRKHDNPDK